MLHFNPLEPARNINLVENYADGVDKQSGICLTTLLKKVSKQTTNCCLVISI